MSPIAQSQFVPLGEVVCCAISDMNAAQVLVTQQSLLEHLVKHYPGIAVPSQDILYTCLGTLIKERKVYHTGEGYFIVTPQTYFITNTPTRENKRVLPSGEDHLVPRAVTYLVSLESHAERATENRAPACHCPSCRCFPDTRTQDAGDVPPATEVTRKAHKDLGASLAQSQAVSASEEAHICVSGKPLPDTKDKEKGKKFGFRFLWRSISRKEKPKTEHSSFSAQFPPEEWPVRNEDSWDNIPRDVEHEIIRRINPVLTVDNLVKHTVLMQKYEEQKRYTSQGTSTDTLTARRSKCPSKEGIKKRQARCAKPHRRGHSHRDRPKARGGRSELRPGSIRPEKSAKVPAAQPAPRTNSFKDGEGQKPLTENPAVLGSHLIYKKQITNPFQGLSLRRSPVSKEHSAGKTGDPKPSQGEAKEKSFQRSRCSKPLRILNGEAQRPYSGQCHDKLNTESAYVTNSAGLPVNDAPREGCAHDPQCRILRPDGQHCSLGESKLRDDHGCGDENEVMPEAFRKSRCRSDRLVETKETRQTHQSQGCSSACGLVDSTIHQFQNLGLLDYSVGTKYLRQHERPDRDSEERVTRALVPEADVVNLENEGFSDDGQASCQDEAEDDGACSSLYLEDDDFSENNDLCQVLPGHTQYFSAGGSRWNQLGKPEVTERSPSERNNQMDSFESRVLKRNHCRRPSDLLSHQEEDQSPDLPAESYDLRSGTRLSFGCEEPHVAESAQASAPASASSEAEVLQDVTGDPGHKPTGWNPSPPNQDVRKHFTEKLELFHTSPRPVSAHEVQHEPNHLEGTEYHSVAGDSGIDSPRTQSLVSNNSVILDGLRRRQNFLQSFESTKNSQTLTSNSLLQLTPVINV
nr:storkhead-box protein 1 isoform X1 [Jaculus jaculus]